MGDNISPLDKSNVAFSQILLYAQRTRRLKFLVMMTHFNSDFDEDFLSDDDVLSYGSVAFPGVMKCFITP